MALAFDIVLSRSLGAEMRGLYAAILGATSFVSTVGGLALGIGLSFVGATSKVTGRDLSGLTLVATAIGSGVSIALLLVLWAVAPDFLQSQVFHREAGGPETMLVCTLLPCVLSDAFAQSALNGTNHIVLMSIQQVAYAITRLLLACILFLVLAMEFKGIVSLLVTVGLLQLVLPQFLLARAMGGVSFRKVRVGLRLLLPYSLKRHVGVLAMALSGRFMVLIVSAMAGLKAAGCYAVAAALAETAALINTVLFQAALHRIGSLGEPEARDLTARSSRVSVLLMGALTVIAVPAVWAGVPVLWGEGFGAAGPVFACLMLGYLLMGTNPIAIYFGVRRDEPWVATIFACVGPAVSLPLAFLLTRPLGVIGAAAAATSGYAAIAMTMVAWFNRRTGTPVSAVMMPTLADVRDVIGEIRRAVSGLKL